MAVYQCKACRTCYGYDRRIPELKPIPDEGRQRYADSDLWNCPHCGMLQDSRDIQSFLGCGGNRMLRELTEDEIQTIIHPERMMVFGPPDHDMMCFMREQFRI